MRGNNRARQRVELFVTCVVDNIFPEVGVATYRILDALGFDVNFDSNQTCCGQPAFNSGYWDEARPIARRLLNQFDGSVPVILPSGSCTAMIRNYYTELFADDPVNRTRAARLAPKVYELTEFVEQNLSLDTDTTLFSKPYETATAIAFHEACHTKRELGVDSQPKSLLSMIKGAQLVDLEQAEVCCGFGGTFSVKYPNISGAMLADKLDKIEQSGAQTVTACDASCLMHIEGGLRKRGSAVRAAHVAELLAESIGED